MAKKLTVKTSININAPVNRVWDALTNPEIIKQYLFGTNTVSDWKKGSPITYSGEWKGKPYQDKGIIIDIVPRKLLHTTYFSGMGGKSDTPEHYANVIYDVTPSGEQTKVTVTQDNIEDEAQLNHMKQNWGAVLGGMKKVLEQ